VTLPPIGLGPAASQYTNTPTPLPWPKPEIAGHEVAPDYLGKRAVIDLVHLAEAAGWTVRVTHAKGSYPSVGGKPGPARDSLAVRMWRGDQRAVAVYVAGAKTWDWKICRMWRLKSFPTDLRNITTLEAKLL
jgi:hypothetical protein